MSRCALCGTELAGDGHLCAHHDYPAEHGWAMRNRLMCDLLHRGIVPPRLDQADDHATLLLAAS